MKQLIILLASGLYSGYAPIASGTFGTAVGILFFLPFMDLAPLAYAVAVAVFTAFACWIAHKAQIIYNELDSGKITIDEIAGFLATMAFIPIAHGNAHEWLTDFLPKVTLGFFLFRLTDILKPFPARWIDRNVKNGAGVVLDDTVAGIYANLLMHLCLWAWVRIH